MAKNGVGCLITDRPEIAAKLPAPQANLADLITRLAQPPRFHALVSRYIHLPGNLLAHPVKNKGAAAPRFTILQAGLLEIVGKILNGLAEQNFGPGQMRPHGRFGAHHIALADRLCDLLVFGNGALAR